MNDKEKSRLQEAILKRYPWDHEKAAHVRAFIEEISIGHIEQDLGDTDILDKLCSDDDARYWAQLSEVLLAHELMQIGLRPTPSHNGPDLLIEYQGGRSGSK